MTQSYRLTGKFIESCNCRVICPCWVDDTPDEEHCAGLFAWHFEEPSHIDGISVAGHDVVSVTVHGDGRKGGNSESVIFYSEALGAQVGAKLTEAFAGRAGGPLAQLALTTGEVIDAAAAQIDMVPDEDRWHVLVSNERGTEFVRANGHPLTFDDGVTPLRLTHTALSAELGIGGDPVQASRSDVIRIDVAGMRGGPLAVDGRSGMTGRFNYQHVPAALTSAKAGSDGAGPAAEADDEG